MKIINTPSPNFSERSISARIDTIVLHYTGMKTLKDALKRMCNPDFEVSAHYCISKKGEVYQLVDDENKAWHAGRSFWRGRDNINNYSIGIEIENLGHEWGYKPFEDGQIEAIIELCKTLIKKYKIKPENIIGHSNVAPERKEDPGELFPWKILSEEGIGIWHDIVITEPEYSKPLDLSDKKILKKIHEKLEKIGYKMPMLKNSNKDYEFESQKIITAFYRHFIPQRISLSQNKRYPENIKWDEISDTIANALIRKIDGKV